MKNTSIQMRSLDMSDGMLVLFVALHRTTCDSSMVINLVRGCKMDKQRSAQFLYRIHISNYFELHHSDEV